MNDFSASKSLHNYILNNFGTSNISNKIRCFSKVFISKNSVLCLIYSVSNKTKLFELFIILINFFGNIIYGKIWVLNAFTHTSIQHIRMDNTDVALEK